MRSFLLVIFLSAVLLFNLSSSRPASNLTVYQTYNDRSINYVQKISSYLFRVKQQLSTQIYDYKRIQSIYLSAQEILQDFINYIPLIDELQKRVHTEENMKIFWEQEIAELDYMTAEQYKTPGAITMKFLQDKYYILDQLVQYFLKLKDDDEDLMERLSNEPIDTFYA